MQHKHNNEGCFTRGAQGMAVLGLMLMLALCAEIAADEPQGTGAESGEPSSIVGRVKQFERELVREHLAVQELGNLVSRVAGKRGLVILTTVTANYTNLARNWIYSVEAMGYAEHVLIVAEDREAYKTLSAEWPGRVLFAHGDTERPALLRLGSAAPGTMFSHSLMARKTHYILALLELGVTVFLNDADTVWLGDPVAFLVDTQHDVLLQEDAAPFEGSLTRFFKGRTGKPVTGTTPGKLHRVGDSILLVRPTEGAKRFVRKWQASIVEASRLGGNTALAQVELNNVLRQTDEIVVDVGILPVQFFPTGCMFFGVGEDMDHPCAEQRKLFREAQVRGNAAPLVVHTPLGTSLESKEACFQQRGLWRMPGPELSLKQVVDNFVGEDRFVVLVTMDSTFFDLVSNWHLSLQRFGYGGKVLFVAEDEEAYRFCVRKWPRQTAFVHRGEALKGQKGSGFDSMYYNELLDRRHHYIAELLELNCTVLFSDVDMFWLKDPSAFFAEDYDVLLQDDGKHFVGFEERFPNNRAGLPQISPNMNYCGCLLRIRPTPRAKEFIKGWAELVQKNKSETGKAVNDQPVLNQLIMATDMSSLSLGVLPVQSFPSGDIFFGARSSHHKAYVEAYSAGKADPVIVHANYMGGHNSKVKALKAHHLWMLPTV